MANDREVLKVVWEGKIPVKFITDDRDMQEQDCFFLMLPRVSYLPLVTDKVLKSWLSFCFSNWNFSWIFQVKKHFQRYIEKEDENGNQIWFSYNEVALKFHIPIGVLFDLLVTDDALPWQITVNFTKYPEDVLFKFPNKWEHFLWKQLVLQLKVSFVFQRCCWKSFHVMFERSRCA